MFTFNHDMSLMIPSGSHFIITDPCYIIENDWDQFIDAYFKSDEGTVGLFPALNNIHRVSDEFLLSSTMWGDGSYKAEVTDTLGFINMTNSPTFCVDSGLFCLMRYETAVNYLRSRNRNPHLIADLANRGLLMHYYTVYESVFTTNGTSRIYTDGFDVDTDDDDDDEDTYEEDTYEDENYE